MVSALRLPALLAVIALIVYGYTVGFKFQVILVVTALVMFYIWRDRQKNSARYSADGRAIFRDGQMEILVSDVSYIWRTWYSFGDSQLYVLTIVKSDGVEFRVPPYASLKVMRQAMKNNVPIVSRESTYEALFGATRRCDVK